MILEEIKSRTAQSHLRVEQSELMRPIADRTLTPPSYARILRKFYGFFQPLEHAIGAIDSLEQVVPDFRNRRKARLLLQDLEALGEAARPDEPLDLCRDLPEVASLPQAMGCLYVMEGSTLGGKFIAKAVQETLGRPTPEVTAFFHGYGPETGARWKDFREALLHYSNATGEEPTIVAAAEETFLKLEKWFSQE